MDLDSTHRDYTGETVTAHELTHVVQQGGGRENGQSVPGLQREILPEWVRNIALIGGGSSAQVISQWYSNPQNEHFIDDLIASVREAPQHFREFIEGSHMMRSRKTWFKLCW